MQSIVRLQHLSSLCEAHGLGVLARWLDGLSRILFSASVPGMAKVGRNVFFHHSGLGVVINRACVIEDSCEIGVHVVLGGRAPVSGAPHLERNVIVHAGAKIIGPVRVGEGSVVAANAVVLADVAPRSLVAGVPAITKRSGIDNSAFRHDAPPRGRAEPLSRPDSRPAN
jgi:serine O-acetyltransferase